METLNLTILLNLATTLVSGQISTSTEISSPHNLNCTDGKIFLYSACYSPCPDNKFPDSELEELYRNCSYVESCHFKPELNNESTIRFTCEDENLHFLSDEEVLTKNSTRIRFYYDGKYYKSADRGLLCIIKPTNRLNFYRNWIAIQKTSQTVLEVDVFGESRTFSAGTSIYRNNTLNTASVVILKLLPDPRQHDQISLGFTAKDGMLNINCSILEIPGPVTTLAVARSTEPRSYAGKSGDDNGITTIIIIVVCVTIIVIIIAVSCIIYRKRKKFIARREERGVELSKAVSEANNYSNVPKANNKRLELNNYDYSTSVNACNPQNTFNNTSSDDVNNTGLSRDGKKIVNMKQLESRIKASGYSEPIDSLKPIKISSKAGDYAEPCNEKECFTSKCLQNKSMLENYDKDHKPKSGGNAYSHVGSNTKESDDYDHFDRAKGNNSKVPDENYSHVPVKGLDEDDYNTTRQILSEETTPNPNYDHIGNI
ncbi:hypothetical protein LOTGIDRAFT_237003 [Lottia gigantea]|uniref:CUB domain-containing protein n=1 Tax=Lottia gigantea TaxID=225164 RepID=V3ZJ71_LOTGI|nr:hypothetical protein LOTGIDRAFT_237003 [Lottia gigantea]ESO82385.1 hypothetical protein LOTGIDRAFT_237003 [Lottia gigantea]